METNTASRAFASVHRIGPELSLAKRAIVALHGRGGSAEDILHLAKQFADAHTHMVAPQARNATWYPYSFMAPDAQNAPFVDHAVEDISRLLNELKAHLHAKDILVVGFSQGACLSLEVTARAPFAVGGTVAFTGGLVGGDLRPEKYNADLTGTRIYIGNSDADAHVPLERSEASAQLLRAMGAEVWLEVFPGMPHTILAQELDHARMHTALPLPE